MVNSTNKYTIETLRDKLLFARYNDSCFCYDEYLFVLGIDIINQLTYDLIDNCKQGHLFGIKVCIDYNDRLSCRLFKEV